MVAAYYGPSDRSSRGPYAAQVKDRRHCEASTPAVEHALTAIIDVILEHGGVLHPDAVIREERGSLSVHCIGGEWGDSPEIPLFDVPLDLLVPVDGAVWGDSAEELRLLQPPPGLTAVQMDLLSLHVALYNAAEKIRWAVATHPALALRDQPEVVSAIRAVRPYFADPWNPPAETFLSTRTFGLRTPATGDPDTARVVYRSVLLPLIDALNHHAHGAALGHDSRAMTVQRKHPTGSSECFTHYGGRKDVLGLALQYGFVDREAGRARCAPVSFAVPGVGSVAVQDDPARRLHPFDPPLITTTPDGITLSHLTFAQEHPERFHTALGLAVRSLAQRRGLSAERAAKAVDAAVEGVVGANVRLLEQMAVAARAVPNVAAAALVVAAAEVQAGVIVDVAKPR